MPKRGSTVAGVPKSTLDKLICASRKDSKGEKFDLQFSKIESTSIKINALKFNGFVFIKNAAKRSPEKCIEYLDFLLKEGGKKLF